MGSLAYFRTRTPRMPGQASQSVAGQSRIATTAEIEAATDDAAAITPSKHLNYHRQGSFSAIVPSGTLLLLATNVAATIPFTQVVFDYTGVYDTTNKRFVAPFDGWYYFSVGVYLDIAGGTAGGTAFINGLYTPSGGSQSVLGLAHNTVDNNAPEFLGARVLWRMNSGDWLSISAQHGNVNSRYVDTLPENTYFNGYYVMGL